MSGINQALKTVREFVDEHKTCKDEIKKLKDRNNTLENVVKTLTDNVKTLMDDAITVNARLNALERCGKCEANAQLKKTCEPCIDIIAQGIASEIAVISNTKMKHGC